MKPQQSKLVWQGESWSLRENQYALPDGTPFTKGMIDHPGAVVLVPLRPFSDGIQILMLDQYRPSVNSFLLELPAGTRKTDEPWIDCAQRELREETGFRAEKFTLLGEILLAPGYSNEKLHIYLATDLHHDPLSQDVDEQIELRPMPFDEVVAMAENGQLQDAKSIAGVLWAAFYLRHNNIPQ